MKINELYNYLHKIPKLGFQEIKAATVGATATVVNFDGVPAAEYGSDAIELLSAAITAVLGADGLQGPIQLVAKIFIFLSRKSPLSVQGISGWGVI